MSAPLDPEILTIFTNELTDRMSDLGSTHGALERMKDATWIIYSMASGGWSDFTTSPESGSNFNLDWLKEFECFPLLVPWMESTRWTFKQVDDLKAAFQVAQALKNDSQN